MSKPKKVVFAAGGTGGHLFPAQALASQLLEENGSLDLFFAGAKLRVNPYFDKEKFRYYDIASTTPFRGSFLKLFQTAAILIKGIVESYLLLSKEKPALVVGFGSFHAFPVLCAAFLKRIPLVLFESNAIPGKVIRLFSKKAKFTGIYFSDAKNYLKGKAVEVEIPTKISSSSLSKQEAKAELNLDLNLVTLLIFGGSQGAKGINKNVLGMLPLLKEEKFPFQIIHLTGCDETAKEVTDLCALLNIPCYVKKFEKQMEKVWKAADIAICRSGAMTLSELLHHEVPAILIPYPAASDQHQLKNALFLEKVGGAIPKIESALTPQTLAQAVLSFIALEKRSEMQKAMRTFKEQQKKGVLSKLISELLEEK